MYVTRESLQAILRNVTGNPNFVLSQDAADAILTAVFGNVLDRVSVPRDATPHVVSVCIGDRLSSCWFGDVDSYMEYPSRGLLVSESRTASHFGLRRKDAARCMAAHVQGIFTAVLEIVVQVCGPVDKVLRNHVFDAFNQRHYDLAVFLA
jgi:hypothetical protein